MKTRRLLTTCFLIVLTVGVRERAGAQQPAGAPPQNAAAGADTVTFRTSTQLVIETVGVKDKSGKPIEGLTAKDFIITEDGAPQTISVFEYQKLPEISAAPLPAEIPADVAPMPPASPWLVFSWTLAVPRRDSGPTV